MSESSVVPAPTAGPRYFRLAAIIAAVLFPVSGLSLLFPGLYAGFVAADVLPAARGQDAFCFLASFILMIAIHLGRRQSMHGLPLLIGTLMFLIYSYALLAFGAVHNGLFLFYILLVGLAAYTVLDTYRDLDVQKYYRRYAGKIPEQATGWFFILLAVATAAVWLVTLLRTMLFRAPVAVINTVYVMDLAFVLPAYFLTGWNLLRRTAWSYLWSELLMFFTAILGSSIVAGFILSVVAGQPEKAGLLLFFGPISLLSIFLITPFVRAARAQAGDLGGDDAFVAD